MGLKAGCDGYSKALALASSTPPTATHQPYGDDWVATASERTTCSRLHRDRDRWPMPFRATSPLLELEPKSVAARAHAGAVRGGCQPSARPRFTTCQQAAGAKRPAPLTSLVVGKWRPSNVEDPLAECAGNWARKAAKFQSTAGPRAQS